MKREDGMGGEAATGCDGGAIPSEPRLVLKNSHLSVAFAGLDNPERTWKWPPTDITLKM